MINIALFLTEFKPINWDWAKWKVLNKRPDFATFFPTRGERWPSWLGSSPKKPEIVRFVLVVVVVVVRQSGGSDIVRQRVWHCSISKINSRVKIWCGQVRGEVVQGEWEQIFTTFCDRPTFGSCWPWIMVTMIIIFTITSIIVMIIIIIICWVWTSLLSQSHKIALTLESCDCHDQV